MGNRASRTAFQGRLFTQTVKQDHASISPGEQSHSELRTWRPCLLSCPTSGGFVMGYIHCQPDWIWNHLEYTPLKGRTTPNVGGTIFMLKLKEACRANVHPLPASGLNATQSLHVLAAMVVHGSNPEPE
ncbi:mCG147741 [Mus musculus]|nr:mCG147741 [Mus musculus]